MCLCPKCKLCGSVFVCPCWTEGNIAQKGWGITSEDIVLKQTAADFYLLYNVWLDDQDDNLFLPYAHKIASLFATYTDMIIGGELRHMPTLFAHPILRDAINDIVARSYSPGQSRSLMWFEWSDLRAKYGLDALDWACSLFRSYTNHSCGGEPWARITELLQLYLKKEISPVLFVDMCFGLEHNGGGYFDKLWRPQLSGLRYILDINLSGEINTLLKHASKSTRDLYTQISLRGDKNALVTRAITD